MRLKPLSVLVLLLSWPTVTACSHSPAPDSLPEQNARLVYPSLPPTKCARSPAPPATDASDNEWAAYKNARDNSGDDCRDKLDAVDAAVSKWPNHATDQLVK